MFASPTIPGGPRIGERIGGMAVKQQPARCKAIAHESGILSALWTPMQHCTLFPAALDRLAHLGEAHPHLPDEPHALVGRLSSIGKPPAPKVE
jgi:hypothetical protein